MFYPKIHLIVKGSDFLTSAQTVAVVNAKRSHLGDTGIDVVQTAEDRGAADFALGLHRARNG